MGLWRFGLASRQAKRFWWCHDGSEQLEVGVKAVGPVHMKPRFSVGEGTLGWCRVDGNDLWGDWALFARSVVASCVESGVGFKKASSLVSGCFRASG